MLTAVGVIDRPDQYNPPVPSPISPAVPRAGGCPGWPATTGTVPGSPAVMVASEAALASPGAVPALKASVIAPGVPGASGVPLFQSTGTSSMPGAIRKGVGGASAS